MRPCDSVSGTRCTRCVPDSNLSLRVRAAAFDARDDFLVAAVLAGAGGQHLELPALALGVARVHAEQVAGENRRLVAAGAGAHFEEDVGVVARILRDQQQTELASSSAMRACAAGISSSASSRISGSRAHRAAPPRGRAAPAHARPAISTTGSSCEYSRDSSRKRALSAITAGSASRRPTSSWRSASASSLRRRLGRHRRFLNSRSAARSRSRSPSQRRLAQRGARRMQQAVGQLVRQALQHFAPGPRPAPSCSRACASACVARRRAVGCASCRSASWRPCACHHAR